eukprot:UN01137
MSSRSQKDRFRGIRTSCDEWRGKSTSSYVSDFGETGFSNSGVCNQWISKLHSNPDNLVSTLISELTHEDEQWTKEQFYKKAPGALRKLKEMLKMHEWAQKVAELSKR